jgi:hypothetical protein
MMAAMVVIPTARTWWLNRVLMIAIAMLPNVVSLIVDLSLFVLRLRLFPLTTGLWFWFPPALRFIFWLGWRLGRTRLVFSNCTAYAPKLPLSHQILGLKNSHQHKNQNW